MLSTNKSPQAKHAETDPGHGTPATAHCQPPEQPRPMLAGRTAEQNAIAGFQTGSGQTYFSQKAHKFPTCCYMLL